MTAYEMRISDWSSDVCSSDLSTRRSSTRLLPRAFAGSSGSIRAHCASENQKKSAIDAASSLKAVNHKSGTMGILLLGPDPSLFPALANHVLGIDHAQRRFRTLPWFRRSRPDRKSVWLGKSLSVRIDLGGVRHMK